MNPNAYTRPKKPTTVQVTRRRDKPAVEVTKVPEPIIVDRATECHVTPPDVAERMVDYLELEGCELIGEPEAGTGNLVAALIEAGHPADQITAFELNVELANRTRQRFDGQVQVIQGDFLEVTDRHYDRIIMNPPFKTALKHVRAAVCQLLDEGICIALVPITFNWEGAELMETLPNTTFASAKVNTKIIRITK